MIDVKKGLVLEGGAMRGLFTAGVIDVMMENGIEYDGVIGVSAGAAFGCNYKSKQIGRVLRYNTKFCRDKRYCGWRVLLKTGNIYSTEFCYGEVPLRHDIFDFDTYDKNPMEFFVVCTDIETGEPVYHKYGGRDDYGFDWIRASASMPLVSKIVEIGDKKLLNGGISDSVPVKYFKSIGYDKNVVVLTRPMGYAKSKNKMMPLVRWMYRKYPKLVKIMAERHNMYNNTLSYISELENSGDIFVIRPNEKLPVGRIEKDPEKLRQAYEIGRATALECLSALKEYLS